MSHSKIFQISKEPIKKQDYFCAGSYYFDDGGNIIGNAVDYIRDMDEKESQECLDFMASHHYAGFAINSRERTLTITSKVEYFKEKYLKVQKACQKLLDNGLDGFIKPDAFWTLGEVSFYGADRYGLQVSEYEGSCDSMDYFMRTVNDGDIFYIGAVIDFHM